MCHCSRATMEVPLAAQEDAIFENVSATSHLVVPDLNITPP